MGLQERITALAQAIGEDIKAMQATAQGALLGEMKLWSLAAAPSGWALCQGQVLNIADYPAAGALLGATWGGDGTATFGLPDLRDRVPIGGSDTRALGTSGGANRIALTQMHLPLHRHTTSIEIPACSVADSMDDTPSPAKILGVASINSGYTVGIYTATSADTTLKPFGAVSGFAGGGMPIDTTPAHVAVNYIIYLGY